MKGEHFKGGEVVLCTDEEKIKQLNSKGVLFDFIPRVKLKQDIAILYSWVDYLTNLKVPIVITKTQKGYTLWKEQTAFTPTHY